MPSALLVARLNWLRLHQGRDDFKLEPVTRSSIYSDSTTTINQEQCSDKINNTGQQTNLGI